MHKLAGRCAFGNVLDAPVADGRGKEPHRAARLLHVSAVGIVGVSTHAPVLRRPTDAHLAGGSRWLDITGADEFSEHRSQHELGEYTRFKLGKLADLHG